MARLRAEGAVRQCFSYIKSFMAPRRTKALFSSFTASIDDTRTKVRDLSPIRNAVQAEMKALAASGVTYVPGFWASLSPNRSTTTEIANVSGEAPSGMFIKLSHQRFGDDRSENDNGHDRVPVVKKSTMKPQAPKPNNHLPANALRPKPGCEDRQAEIDIPSARRDKGPNLASSADDLRPGHRPSACVLRE